METDSDNPAGRLHDFLTVLRQHDPNTSTALAVRRALDLDDDAPLPVVLQLLSIVTRWPEEIRVAVEALDGVNHARLLEWIPRVGNALNGVSNMSGQLNSVLPHYNDVDLSNLGHASDALHYRAPEPIIGTEKLTDLSALVREAIEAVIADTDLNDEARHWLIARLQEVLAALTHFRVSGYEGVEAAMERLHGGIIHRPATQTTTTYGWFNRLWATLSLSAQGTKQIAEAGSAVMGIIEQATN